MFIRAEPAVEPACEAEEAEDDTPNIDETVLAILDEPELEEAVDVELLDLQLVIANANMVHRATEINFVFIIDKFYKVKRYSTKVQS